MRFNWSWNHSISWIISSCSLWGVSSIFNGACGVSSGRHRWVEYADNGNYNASAVPPEWHSWLHYISDHTADQVCLSFIKSVSPCFILIILREQRPGSLQGPTKFLVGHGQRELIIGDRQASSRSGRFGLLYHCRIGIHPARLRDSVWPAFLTSSRWLLEGNRPSLLIEVFLFSFFYSYWSWSQRHMEWHTGRTSQAVEMA